MTIQNNLTIVIPSFNRHEFLLRTMLFWANTGFKVIVVDGSSVKLDSSLVPINNNISYYHIKMGWGRRLLFAASKIETDYVIMASDDEYYVPSGLKSLVEFLDINTDYSSCIGRCLGFEIDENKLFGVSQYPKLNGYSVLSNDPASRVKNHMEDYVMSLVWSVTRTPVWKLAAETYASEEFRLFCQAELQFEMILAFAGKSKVLPVLTWLRSIGENNPIANTEPSLDSSSPMNVFWRESKRLHEAEQFLNVMTNTFMLLRKGDKKYCHNAVSAGCEAYCQWVDSRNLIYRSRLRKIMNNIPASLKSSLRRIMSQIEKNKRINIVSAAKRLENEGVFVDYEAVKIVEKSLFSFYKSYEKKFV